MIPQVGLRPTGWLNCARFTCNSPKKMSPDIYYQPLSCVSLNKKAYLYYLPPLPPSLPAQPSLQPLPPSIPCLPAFLRGKFIFPGSPISQKSYFPESQIFWKVKFPGKSNFVESQILWKVKFPVISNFQGSQLFQEVNFSREVNFPGKSTFPGNKLFQ